MRVKSLSISNVRNISTARIDFDPCLNCFIGDNGAGKTSILEALSVLSKGRSFRPGQISSLIGSGGNSLQVVSKVESQSGDSHQLGIERDPDQWTARHNGADVTNLSDLTELLPFVVLEPNSHTLVSGPPDGRRRYLDWGVFHVEHHFLTVWRRYQRVLKQRNAALKQANRLMVESLDAQFIQLGERLHQARKEHVERLDGLLQKQLALFCETLENVTLNYKKGWSGDSLAEALELSVTRDIERGITGPGPHKADLLLAIDGIPAKERLSRGEQKAMTAALIMAQAHMIGEKGEMPVLMFDDLASEFDEVHLSRVLRVGLELGAQILVTGTELVSAIGSCNSPYTVFHVKHGCIARFDDKLA